nr:YraN family protein [Bosea psychrotolerans]
MAVLWLSMKGYRLLARRFGGKGGEIDLIVKRGRTIAFVEVKARGALEDALGAITPQKRRLVEARIRQWLAQNPWAMGHHLRADAVFLAPRHWPRHVLGVFELVL